MGDTWVLQGSTGQQGLTASPGTEGGLGHRETELMLQPRILCRILGTIVPGCNIVDWDIGHDCSWVRVLPANISLLGLKAKMGF